MPQKNYEEELIRKVNKMHAEERARQSDVLRHLVLMNNILMTIVYLLEKTDDLSSSERELIDSQLTERLKEFEQAGKRVTK
mgnify:CR=1 FL=1